MHYAAAKGHRLALEMVRVHVSLICIFCLQKLNSKLCLFFQIGISDVFLRLRKWGFKYRLHVVIMELNAN